MKKFFIFLVVAGFVWYFHNSGKIETFEKINLDQFKQQAIDNFKKEKTINAINSKRESDQQEINEIINR